MKRTINIILSVMLLLSTLSPLQAGAVKHGSNFYATFLQNWICRDWTEARWEQELQAAKEAGFQPIILQSTCDIVRGEAVAGGDAQDPSNYPDTSEFCMFPSGNAVLSGAFRSSQNQGDALKLALIAAKQTEMQLWIGFVNDDLWWKYGWGIPHAAFCAAQNPCASCRWNIVPKPFGSSSGKQQEAILKPCKAYWSVFRRK